MSSLHSPIPSERCIYYHETYYNGNWDVSYRRFEPEDVMPYYDIYNSGKIYIYIKQKKSFLWIFKWDKIWKRSVDDITIEEKPIRKVCYE